jgi:hypothetical protein
VVSPLKRFLGDIMGALFERRLAGGPGRKLGRWDVI